VTVLEELAQRGGLIRFLWQHPNPERFIVRKNLNRIHRMPCVHQFFVGAEEVENFALLLEEKGIASEIRQCPACKRVYAVVLVS
jgi:hypothetical protein